MTTSECVLYHPHPAAARRHDQFQNTAIDLRDNERYHYYENQLVKPQANYTPKNGILPQYPLDLFIPPPPYYRGGGSVDISDLPPLPETPVEIESFPYPDDVFSNQAVAGDRRPLQYEFDARSEVFTRSQLRSGSSHSYSGNNRILPEYKKLQGEMGSAGSMIVENRPLSELQPSRILKQKDQYALSVNREKPCGGMKKKLRHSLDKLNIRAFSWSNTDKLSSSSSSSVTMRPKKCPKGKTGVRRNSDSNAPTAINSTTSVLSKPRINRESPVVRPNSSSARSDAISVRKTEGNSVISKGWKQGGKLIKAYKGENGDSSRSTPTRNRNNEYEHFTLAPRSPYQINQTNLEHHHRNVQNNQTVLPVDSNTYYTPDTRYENIDYQSQMNFDREQAYADGLYHPHDNGNIEMVDVLSPRKQAGYDPRHFILRDRNLLGIQQDISRAKGTWGLLRNAEKVTRPIHCTSTSISSPASAYNSPFGSTEVLLIPGHRPRAKSTDKIVDTISENHMFAKPARPKEKMMPPPKLTPVSGKLVVSKNSDASAIIRPTAFKAVIPATRRISPPDSIKGSQYHDDPIPTHAYGCINSPNTDSGRNSTSSVNVCGGKAGSCYSFSEGYESACVSASTAQDQHSDRGSDSGGQAAVTPPRQVDNGLHTRSTSDDVMIRNLENNVLKQENDVYEDESREKIYMEDRGRTTYNPRMKTQLQSQDVRASEIRCIAPADMNADAEDSQERADAGSGQDRLEACQWDLQQKCGEIAMLKRLLRESQADVNRRSSEVAAQLSQNCDLRRQFQQRDREATELLGKLKARDVEIIELEKKLRNCSNSTPHSRSSSSSSSVTHGRNSISLSISSPPPSPSPREKFGQVRSKSRKFLDSTEFNNNNNGHVDLVQSHLLLQAEVETLRRKLAVVEDQKKIEQERFGTEKAKWNDEKSKVIRYQKKLQVGYVEIRNHSKELEEQIQSLTEELKNLRKSVKNETPCGELRFPTDI